MAKKLKSVPVNRMAGAAGEGVMIETLSFKNAQALHKATGDNAEEATQSHRHDRHSFFLLQTGTITVEIDFEKYKIKAPSVIYIHPDQVHRTTVFKDVTVTSWAINNENLNPVYLAMLQNITPVKPLVLEAETFSILSEATSLSIKFSERKNDRLHQLLLKDSCNALVALVLSQYLAQSKPADKFSRFEAVTKSFRDLLQHNYATCKSPAQYARQLNISTAYLNECVKNATGYPVSHHIQQRVLLEARRLLYHSDKSVKEIAAELGYDDYAYFSRMFTKATGLTPLAFRNKNRD